MFYAKNSRRNRDPHAPVIVRNGLGFVSGQLPIEAGALKYVGRVGVELTLDDARAAARLAARNVLAQIGRALGDWRFLTGLMRLEGFVASADDFYDQPAVLDAASELFLEVLGDRGTHARAAFAVPRLPMNAPVELVVTFAATTE